MPAPGRLERLARCDENVVSASAAGGCQESKTYYTDGSRWHGGGFKAL